MVAVILALASSVAYGITDFLGGLTNRSVSLLPILVISQGTGLLLLSVVVLWRGEGPPGGAFHYLIRCQPPDAAGRPSAVSWPRG